MSLVVFRFSPLPISAISGTGTGELLDIVCSGLKKNMVSSHWQYCTDSSYAALTKLAAWESSLICSVTKSQIFLPL